MDVRNRIRDNHSARSMTKIIHCEEIAPDPVTITLGNIRIDATRISAYNTIRMLKLTQDIEKKELVRADAWEIICDICKEQHQCTSDDELLKAGTLAQIWQFISAITTCILQTYEPLEAEISPFYRLLEMEQAQRKSTSTESSPESYSPQAGRDNTCCTS